MLTQINMNNVPQMNAKDLNPHLFVGVQDPVIRAFVNEWQEFFKVLTCTLFIYIAYGIALCLFGWSVTALWPLINEWIEIICMVSSTALTVMFLKWIHEESEHADAYISKLKADLAAKNAIIRELELKLDSDNDSNDNDNDSNDNDSNDNDNDSNDNDSNDNDSNDNDSNDNDSNDNDSNDNDSNDNDPDSDYDPDLDEY